MENKQTLGVSPTFVQTQSWLTDLMARSAEDSTSSKHPAFTRGPTYRFPVPTKRHISDHVGIASLVGGSATPLKNRTSSIGMMTLTQYFWENAKFMATIHHQPVIFSWWDSPSPTLAPCPASSREKLVQICTWHAWRLDVAPTGSKRRNISKP